MTSLRSLMLSLAVGAALGSVTGAAYALAAGTAIAYGIGTGLFVAGIVALTMGLLGATEPPEGWVMGRRTTDGRRGRRGLLATVAEDDPDSPPVSSWALALWGVVVGGGLIALSAGAFALS